MDQNNRFIKVGINIGIRWLINDGHKDLAVQFIEYVKTNHSYDVMKEHETINKMINDPNFTITGIPKLMEDIAVGIYTKPQEQTQNNETKEEKIDDKPKRGRPKGSKNKFRRK
jgi:hypothetical protein